MQPPRTEVTELLAAISSGQGAAAEQLLPLVYAELRELAHRRMRGEGPQTLQPTALVHEAYLRLVQGDPSWDSRAHFFAAAAEAMRRILIERARRQGRLRHGGGQRRLDLDQAEIGIGADEQLLALDQALDRLQLIDARMAQVVKLRYYAGMSLTEVAQALAVAPRTVNRDWLAARAWLQRELSPDATDEPGSTP
ncbi:MAG: sigma-70 family RNA polymerase sigma factor [Xanthomonadales bacterium]|nr:sigma-70 family RNA polymerase sigma factor [Xanthomonadales bacterium]MCB1636074.1 sigma-70 family RNA polymerase sigma factor [Xanthomonadales bacterium]